MNTEPLASCAKCGQTANNLKRCSKCRATMYCSRDCQVADWKSHKGKCFVPDGSDSATITDLKNAQAQDGRDVDSAAHAGDGSDDMVQGVRINCGPIGVFPRFEVEHFPKTHKIFTDGELCPFPKLYGEEILLYSPLIAEKRPFLGGTKTGAGDCQPAVYLRIEPHDGFAPFHWQINDPGPCYVVRKNKQPLTVQLVDMMYEYHSDLLSSDHFENPPDARPPVNRKTFADYNKHNARWQMLGGR